MDGTKTGTRKTLERLVGVCAKYSMATTTERHKLAIVVDVLEELIYAKRGYDPDLQRLYNMAREDLAGRGKVGQ